MTRDCVVVFAFLLSRALGIARERREYVPVGSRAHIAAMDGGVPRLQEHIAAHVRERPGQRRTHALLPGYFIALSARISAAPLAEKEI